MLNLSKHIFICIYLFFPFLIYIVLITQTSNYTKHKDTLFLTISLIVSELLLIFLSPSLKQESLLILTIPLILSYITNNKKTLIINHLILLCYFYFSKDISFSIVNIYFLLIFLFYLKFKKKFFQKIIINFYLFLNFLILIILNYQHLNFSLILNIFLHIFLSIFYLYFLILLLKKNNLIINMNNKLKELEKERRLKTSMFKLTHELKNPLAVCNGYLEMMDFANENKTKHYFSILKDEIKRSLTIINDFSSFGKIKELTKEELDINYLFEEIKDTLIALYSKNNAEIVFNNDNEIYFIGDYSRLKQVFINILKNALEAKNKDILLVSIKVKELKEKIRIIIQDNGCGMTKEELTHVGEIFYTTKSNGTGLGLSYCKEIIDLHGGTISYKSQKNVGTKVTIYLPK